MRKKFSSKMPVFDKSIVYLLYPFVIIIAKIIRYTVMKSTILAYFIGKDFLQKILYGTPAWAFGDSNTNTVIFFKTFNFLSLRTTEAFEVAVTVIYSIIILLLLTRARKTFTFLQLIFTFAMIGVLNIFCFALQKEPIQMLFFLAIYFVIISPKLSERQKDIALMLILLVSAVTFRPYYMLIIGFYIVVKIVITALLNQKRRLSKKKIVLLIFFMGVVYYLVLTVMRKISPSNYMMLLYARSSTRGEAVDITTRIAPWFSSSNVNNYLLIYLTTVLRLLFPLELLGKRPVYVVYVIYQLMLTYIIFTNLKKIKQNPSYKNTALFFYLAFLFMSAASESDFGTWVRHETALFPIYLIITDVIQMKCKKGEVV